MNTNVKIKDVWGETIEKVAIIAILALAIVAAPVMAQDVSAAGGRGTDILGNGIFESSDGLKFPVVSDTNFDSITVGNDRANAFGWDGFFPFNNRQANAENNLEIKKNQEVGNCSPCTDGTCGDSCTTVNIDQVHVGDRTAQAFGLASAVNNVKLVLNQAP